MTRKRSDLEAPTTVVNLSGVTLGEAEINLLSKELSFCPIPHHMEKEEIRDDVERFFRWLRLKESFQEKEEEEETDMDTLLHPPSSWMPPKRRDAALEMYIKKTRTDVESHLNDLQARKCKDNLQPKESSALKKPPTTH